MDKEYRFIIDRCFSCGYEDRRWQIIYNNTIPVGFRKCPKCGRHNFTFYRSLRRDTAGNDKSRK